MGGMNKIITTMLTLLISLTGCASDEDLQPEPLIECHVEVFGDCFNCQLELDGDALDNGDGGHNCIAPLDEDTPDYDYGICQPRVQCQGQS